MNTVTIVGNCSELYLNYTKTEKAILTFGVATTRKVNDQEYTTFHNVKVWADAAERCAAEIIKGDRVIVTGRLETEQYEKDGQTIKKVVIVADEVGRSLRWARKDS